MEITLKLACLPDDDGIVRPKSKSFSYKYSDLCNVINNQDKEIPLMLYYFNDCAYYKYESFFNSVDIIGEMIDFYPDKYEAKFDIANLYEGTPFSEYKIGLMGIYDNKIVYEHDNNENFLIDLKNKDQFSIFGFELINRWRTIFR